MKRLFRLFLLATSVFCLYVYRYRIINAFLKSKWLRSQLLNLAMQLPYVRKLVVRQL